MQAHSNVGRRLNRAATLLTHAVTAFIAEERGEDLVEYALLTTSVGLATIAAVAALESAIGTTYTSWDTVINSLWESPNP